MLKLLCASTVVATTVALAPIASADTVGALEGAFAPQGVTESQLQGQVCNLNPCQYIPYNNNQPPYPSISDGEAALNNWINSTPGPKIVYGFSLGSVVANQWIVDHSSNPVADVTFILLGNPSRGSGGIVAVLGMPGSGPAGLPAGEPYKVVDIGRQYELWSDFPNNSSSPYYFLAVINAIAGDSLHNYTGIDMNDPRMVVWTDGNITYKLMPTDVLPLVSMFPMLDNATLKPLVDTAYNRPVAISGPTPATATVATQEVTTWDGLATTGTALNVDSSSQPNVALSPTAEATKPPRKPKARQAALSHPKLGTSAAHGRADQGGTTSGQKSAAKRDPAKAASNAPKKADHPKKADTPKREAKKQK